MKLVSNILKLCAAALLPVLGSVSFSYAATPARVNPAFLRDVSSTTTSAAYRVKSAATARRPLGLRPSPVDMSHMAGRDVSGLISRRAGISAAAATSYSASYDLRTTTYTKLTAIRDQGYYGSCWTFATYGSLESNLLPSETWDFSENNLAMNSGFDNSDPMNGGGTSLMSAAYLARWGGPVNETDDPYPASWSGETDAQLLANEVKRTGLAVQKHLQEMFWLPQAATYNETAFKNNVKAAITSYGAVYSSIYWDDNASKSNYLTFYNPNCNKPYGVTGYHCSCGSSCGVHAIALVGWNDSYLASNFKTTPKGPGAFIARNSWGADVGDGGYFYISYYDTSIGGESAVFDVAEATSNYTKVYQYDPLGFTYEMGNGDVGGVDSYMEWMANISLPPPRPGM